VLIAVVGERTADGFAMVDTGGLRRRARRPPPCPPTERTPVNVAARIMTLSIPAPALAMVFTGARSGYRFLA
jgi:hypothetical protein